ncbi:MAG: hypothetical protein JSV65_07280 [Armatimonadota bacterium]|nr:MAG: hypothetical protein JSV65_07280 [Armatimonadota bacterium]
MRPGRPLTFSACVLIACAAWTVALTQAWNVVSVVCAASITALCAAIVLLRSPVRHRVPEHPHRPRQRDESAEFRRGLFDLCAALKLGVRFCEEHLDSQPEVLIEQLQQMCDNISCFVNDTTRPVRFSQSGRWPWRYARVLWPWRTDAKERAPR